MTAMNQNNEANAEAHRSQELVDRITPILRGQGSTVQCATLADLVAMWLAGHVMLEEVELDKKPNTDQAREAMLSSFIGLVRELVPVNEQPVLAKLKTATSSRRDH